MDKGKLIVIEGLDGSGKATQTALLKKALEDRGVQIKQVSFPDYNNPSSSLVKMYLNGELGGSPDDVNAYAASSFYAVDRYASYKKYWQEDYNSGKVIIADRYSTSNAIYQLSKVEKDKRDEFLQWLANYEYDCMGLPKPDMVIYLDMPLGVSQKLLTQRYKGNESKKDLHESNFKFLEQCRESAIYSAERMDWQIINCAENGNPRTIESIHNDIINIIDNVI